MGAITQYALQVALLLCVVYLLYKWTLASCTFSRFNRVVLLCMYVIVLIAIPAYTLYSSAYTEPDAESPELQIKEEVTALSDRPAPMWPKIVSIIYMAGAIVAIVVTSHSILHIMQIIRHGVKEKRDKFTLVFSDNKKISPFSWGKYIVVPYEETPNDDLDMIIAHERVHINLCHWIDLAIGQAIIIINWFNPAAYLMMRELQNVHEFEVDNFMIKSGIDRRQYQMLLIRNASGSLFPSIADRLCHGQLKTRIKLMMSPRSNPLRKVLASLFVPIVAMTIFGINTPVLASQLSEIAGTYIFTSDYNQLIYEVYGVNHLVYYTRDGQLVSISMDLPEGETPKFYINKHLASQSELSHIKSDDVLFIMGDSNNHRFIIKTK